MRYTIAEIKTLFPAGTIVYYTIKTEYRTSHILAEYTPNAPDTVTWHTPDIENRPIPILDDDIHATIIHSPPTQGPMT